MESGPANPATMTLLEEEIDLLKNSQDLAPFGSKLLTQGPHQERLLKMYSEIRKQQLDLAMKQAKLGEQSSV